MKKLFSLSLIAALSVAISATAQKAGTAIPTAAEPKPTAGTDRLTGMAKQKESEARSIASNLAFRNIGPTIMSGRVVDIDVNPNDPTVFYVAYASGGVWFTNNNGTSFSPVFDNQHMLDIGDIAVNWQTESTRGNAQPIIWVGTGECNSSRSSYAGTGVYKSADGGKTWQHKGLPETHHIGKILLNPDDPNTVYVAAIGHLYSPNKDRGVFKTTDGGETWKQVLFIDENTGVIDLFFDPNNSRNLFAISWQRARKAWNFEEAGGKSGIYKTDNAGENWKLISTATSGLPQGENTGRMGIAIFPGNSSIMYTIVDNQSQNGKAKLDSEKLRPADFRTMNAAQFQALDDKKLETYLRNYGFPEKHTPTSVKEQVRKNEFGPVALADYVSDANSDLFNKPIVGAEIYRSDDGGINWKKANSKPIDGLFYTYGYYFGKIWVSPFNADEIFVAGVSLMQSVDGGKTVKPIDGDNQHGDHHSLWLNPFRKGHLINGNDGGMNLSWDNGKHWIKANTPAVGQFYAVNVDMEKPYNVYGGLQDNGVWMASSTSTVNTEWQGEGQNPYRRILGGDGMQVQTDPRNNHIVYTGYQFGHYFRINTETHQEIELHPEMELGDKPLRYNWQAPIWLSVHNPDILYIGAQKLFRSMDQGDHFTPLSGDHTRGGRTGDVPYGTLSSIHESPMKFGLLYTGSDDGLIHVSKDGGQNWTRISDKLPQHLRVNRIIASAHSEGRVYAVLSGFQWDHFNAYVYASDDYGANWKMIFTDLPIEPVNVLREDPVNENLLFVGTDHGLYTSINRGKTSMRLVNNLPPVAIHDLVIHPREHDLIVGTHGRSIYIASIETLEKTTEEIVAKSLFVYEIPTARQYTDYIEVDGEYQATTVTPFSLTWYQKQKSVNKIELKSADGSLLFAVLTDSSESGLNFLNVPIAVDSAYASNYEQWVEENGKGKKVQKLQEGKSVLLPGEYQIIISSGTFKESANFIVQRRREQ
jgi:photosystem II stability/assembly factor-like uncharacterized protein